ncbi:MAG: hypothetical protein JNM65_04615 [Verrucomicrobiaceae bacterium]|nr:hypothetical protein [Verrucomicrobiaceae bacterium]
MNLDLKLPCLPVPSLNEAVLRRSLSALGKIKEQNERRWGGGGSPAFDNRKEKIRKRLQGAVNPAQELQKIQATEVGWQRLLLSLYVESHGQDWLPPFDEGLAAQILGNDGAQWNASRRRQVTQLFFERFDSLPALSFIASALRAAYSSPGSPSGGSTALWASTCSTIFQLDGPKGVASAVKSGETLAQLMERHGIPNTGRYSEKLRQIYLLESIQRCALGAEPEALAEIEKEKTQPAIDSLPLGAAALRILVTRVEGEEHRKWPEGWRKWLSRLGCDPRIGRHTAEGAKWWGWATASQWNLAVQGIIGLSLKFFFDFLDGTVSAHQWEERRQFLETCFEAGKIVDARLVLNAQCMQRLPVKMRDKWNTANLSSTTEDTCIIALRCTDDIYVLEGTHSYGLRAFHRSFPVQGFWERTRQQYGDAELRISPNRCPVFVRHNGNWVRNFLNELRSAFHVEWSPRRR